MYGVTKGVYLYNHERLQELNDRIYQRNLPSQALQTHFSPRSTDTRHMMFPVVNSHTPSNYPINQLPNHNINNQFNPGSNSPYSGYMTNVDNESRIRNLFFSNQSAAQSKYIPSSTSDMYQYDIQRELVKHNEQWNTQQIPLIEKPASNIEQAQPYPRLFDVQQFHPVDVNEYKLGMDRFHNHTRQQVKNL